MPKTITEYLDDAVNDNGAQNIVSTEKIQATVKNMLEIKRFGKYSILNVNSKNNDPPISPGCTGGCGYRRALDD